ncbi:IS1 family transposase [Candidatus Thiothrix sp. Deng01]|uniref:IS1 family transposase n=1 Tax=Candidatus Thiothrix phosphatis TaxID=3112415 RepID=A0ABU6CSQ0_9GAMM|nr:IS1 family transposase [Candidatus Thiothrix sp. Deng01]MEB4589799.1 IS1 family transposase [Candidatus Thiothrix sp. Deng01]
MVNEAELDGQGSFVGNKGNQRWLWYAVDHISNTVLA